MSTSATLENRRRYPADFRLVEPEYARYVHNADFDLPSALPEQ